MNRLGTYMKRNILITALAGMLALFLVASACNSADTDTQPPQDELGSDHTH